MNYKEIIKQLESLAEEAESHFEKMGDDEIFRKDKEALQAAIKIVQEHEKRMEMYKEIVKLGSIRILQIIAKYIVKHKNYWGCNEYVLQDEDAKLDGINMFSELIAILPEKKDDEGGRV